VTNSSRGSRACILPPGHTPPAPRIPRAATDRDDATCPAGCGGCCRSWGRVENALCNESALYGAGCQRVMMLRVAAAWLAHQHSLRASSCIRCRETFKHHVPAAGVPPTCTRCHQEGIQQVPQGCALPLQRCPQRLSAIRGCIDCRQHAPGTWIPQLPHQRRVCPNSRQFGVWNAHAAT